MTTSPEPTFSPSERSKIGTIAHNRSFSRRDWREYGLPDRLFLRALRAGLLTRVSRGQYAPTKKGWAEIERE